MIHAEISIYPIGMNTTSVSSYITKAIESIKNIQKIKYQINPMSTILESDEIYAIYDA